MGIIRFFVILFLQTRKKYELSGSSEADLKGLYFKITSGARFGRNVKFVRKSVAGTLEFKNSNGKMIIKEMELFGGKTCIFWAEDPEKDITACFKRGEKEFFFHKLTQLGGEKKKRKFLSNG